MTGAYTSCPSECNEIKAISSLVVDGTNIISSSLSGELSIWRLVSLPVSKSDSIPSDWFRDPDSQAPTPPATPRYDYTTTQMVPQKSKSIYQYGIEEYNVDARIECIKLDQNKLVLGLSQIPFLQIWDSKNWKLLELKHQVDEPIYSIDIKENLVISTSHSTVFVYDLTLEQTKKYSLDLQHIVNVSWLYGMKNHAIIMMNDGNWRIYNFCYELVTCLLDVQSIAGLVTGFIQPFEYVTSEHVHGYKVICGYQNGNIKSWIFTSNWTFNAQPTLSSISDKVTAIKIVSNMVVGATWDGKVRIWDIKNDSLRRSLKCEQSSGITSVDIINGMIITGHYNGKLTYWDFASEASQSRNRKRIKL
jgi:WD40 repeat protein